MKTKGCCGLSTPLASFLVVILGLSLVACKGGAASGAKADGGAAGASSGRRGALAFAVETTKIEPEQVAYIVNAPGTVEAFERVQITARVSGVVDKISFSEGALVKQGQVLLIIDAERYRLAVNLNQVYLDKSLAQLADVEAALARREAASREHPGIIQGEELETYRTKVRVAKIDVAEKRENLKQANVNLRDSAIRAPIDGVIQSRSVETGQLVSPGMLLAAMIRPEPLLLRFPVTTLEAPRLRPGMIATFRLRETQRVFRAKIILVSAAADPKTHQVSITAEVEPTDHPYWLRPGSFCDVNIVVRASKSAPVVPQTAVRPSERGFVAYVIEADTARERLLQLGMHTTDGRVEVREGLKAGDVLVVRGAEALFDGARVTTQGAEARPTAAPSASEYVENPPPVGSNFPSLASSADAGAKPAGLRP